MSHPPGILCVGPFEVDSAFRYFCDALQQCGCRVVRAGPQLFGKYPPEERPPVFDFGIFTPRIGLDMEALLRQPVSLRDLIRRCHRQAFEPEVVLWKPLAVDVEPADMPSGGVRFIPYVERAACDPYVHVWTNFGARPVDAYCPEPDLADELRAAGLQVTARPDPPSVLEYVRRLNDAVVAVTRAVDARLEREAISCGADYYWLSAEDRAPAKLDPPTRVRQIAEARRAAPESATRAFALANNQRTYRRHAAEVLDAFGYEPSMPRLWT